MIPAQHADKIALRKPLEYGDAARAILKLTSDDRVSRHEAASSAILGKLPPSELNLLLPHLRKVHLSKGQLLERRGQRVSTIDFPTGCVASLIAVGKETTRLEVGLVGKEGMTGLGTLVGDDRTLYETQILVKGPALSVSAAELMKILNSLPGLHLIADSDVKPATNPIKDRPPFRFEAGHRSDQRPASFRH